MASDSCTGLWALGTEFLVRLANHWAYPLPSRLQACPRPCIVLRHQRPPRRFPFDVRKRLHGRTQLPGAVAQHLPLVPEGTITPASAISVSVEYR